MFVAVRANVTGHMAGAYALKNGYALYHEGTAPLFRGAVAPNHAGQSVTFQWQQNSGKGWQPYLSQAQGLDSNSRIAVFLSSGAVKGPAYRVRIVWPGGSGSAASAAPWSYFKVTS